LKLTKNNIVIILFIITLFSLIAYLLIGSDIEEPDHIEPIVLSGEDVNSIFNSSLSGFGIRKEWVNEIKRKKEDSLFAAYSVTVPSDLPITILIREISNSYPDSSVRIVSVEEKINGRSKLDIYSGDYKKLSVNFEYNKNLARAAGQVGVIVENISSLNDEDLKDIFNTPEIFAALLTPSSKSKGVAQQILYSKKEYGVLLDDQISEIEFKLSDNYSEARLKSSFRTILGAFDKAIFFVADDESKLYNSSIFPFVRKEIEKRKIPLILKSSFEKVEGFNQEEFLLNFKSTVAGSAEVKGKLILVSAENYKELWTEIINFRKVGYKFINPSQLKPLYL
jgi:hypothetical protein